jgi:hypothetical protein
MLPLGVRVPYGDARFFAAHDVSGYKVLIRLLGMHWKNYA